MFLIGQNLIHAHMTYSFLELLILILVALVQMFIVWSLFLTTSKKYCMKWNENKETYIFTRITMLKNPVFYLELKSLSTIFVLYQSHEHF